MPKFKKNDTVMIYHDPFAQEVQEGSAVLLRHVDTRSDGLEKWIVRFTDPGVADRNVERLVRP